MKVARQPSSPRAPRLLPSPSAIILSPPVAAHGLPDPRYVAFPCRSSRTLHHQIATHPISFQLLIHSVAKTPGWCQKRPLSLNSLTFNFAPSLSPLESTLMDELRVLAEISRNCPLATPLQSTLTDFAPVTPLNATLTKMSREAHPTPRRAPVPTPLTFLPFPVIISPGCPARLACAANPISFQRLAREH